MRAVRVPFSPARPSRLKNEAGVLPAAYMRSSTSTVIGRKSTSRWLPAVAVERTTVSPWRTTTAPEACLAIFPVSKEISFPAISTETVVTASVLLMQLSFLARASDWAGRVLRCLRYPNGASLLGVRAEPPHDRVAREAPLAADFAARQIAR